MAVTIVNFRGDLSGVLAVTVTLIPAVGSAFSPFATEEKDGKDSLDPSLAIDDRYEYTYTDGLDPEKAIPHQLGIMIEVINTGEEAFEFQSAVFADLVVKDLFEHAASVRLVGLTGRYVIDRSEKEGSPILLQEDMDFVYPQTPPGKHQFFNIK